MDLICGSRHGEYNISNTARCSTREELGCIAEVDVGCNGGDKDKAEAFQLRNALVGRKKTA